MANLALSTLIAFLKANAKLVPEIGTIAFLRAEADPGLCVLPMERLYAYQTFKPLALTLRTLGFDVTHELPKRAAMVLAIPTKQKRESLAMIANAGLLLETSGVIVVACENHRGARSYREALHDLFGEVESWSKNHCIVAWARKDPTRFDEKLADEWQRAGRPQNIPETSHLSQPGVFSWNEIDEGSALLAAKIPATLSGHGADFGAGTGYLSMAALRRTTQVDSLALYEAEYLALDCARKNLEALASHALLSYHWSDLVQEPPGQQYDWILMNPPCHDARELDMELGQKFVERAYQALRDKGKLYMVGNAHLGYERSLRSRFTNVDVDNSNPRFTIFIASKGA